MNKKASELGYNVIAKSAGLFVFSSETPCQNAVSAASNYGLGELMKIHTSRNIESNDIISSDMIFAVSPNHYEMLKPQVELLNSTRSDGKTTELFCLGNGIDDPFGGTEEDYVKCYGEIADCCDRILSELSRL